MSAPGFWDDQAHAAQVSAEHARTTRRLDGYRTLQRDYEDARELAALDGGELDDELAVTLRRCTTSSRACRRRRCSTASTTQATRW